MDQYSEHIKRITEDLNRTIGNELSDHELRMRDLINNSKIDTAEYVKEMFGDDEQIEYEVEVTGNDLHAVLIDIKPKNLYTACKFLGFNVEVKCPIEGQAEFERVTIMYDHKDGMTIIPVDPLDNLDDIIPVF